MAAVEDLKVRLSFQGRDAERGMSRAENRMKRLSGATRDASGRMRDARGRFTRAGGAAAKSAKGFSLTKGALLKVAGTAVAAGFAIKKVTDIGFGFTDAFAGVRAVLSPVGGTAADFKMLESLARDLGRTTSKTAIEAAEGMELLARAGFKPVEIMGAIPAVLRAAEAEGLDLATATDIVASSLRGFGLDASEAARVSDTLAFTSARTNTSMVALREGLKFVAPKAREMGLSLEDTTATLGILANVGLKGSVGATALKNALTKLATGAKKGVFSIGKVKVKITEADGSMRNWEEIMREILPAFGAIKNEATRAAELSKLFGIRGATAVSAIRATKPEDIASIFDDIREKSKGAAEEMAKIKLATPTGEMKLLVSAISDVAINLTDMISAKFSSGVKGLTGSIADLGFAFALDAKPAAERTAEEIDKFKLLSPTIKGIVEGVKFFGETISEIFGVFAEVTRDVFGSFELDGASLMDVISRIVKVSLTLIKTMTDLFVRMSDTSTLKGLWTVFEAGLTVVEAVVGTLAEIPGVMDDIREGIEPLREVLELIGAVPPKVLTREEVFGPRKGVVARGGELETEAFARRARERVAAEARRRALDPSRVISLAPAAAPGISMVGAPREALLAEASRFGVAPPGATPDAPLAGELGLLRRELPKTLTKALKTAPIVVVAELDGLKVSKGVGRAEDEATSRGVGLVGAPTVGGIP